MTCRAVALLALTLGGLGCAQRLATPPRATASAVEWTLPGRLVGAQHLFRLAAAGAGEAGHGRLALILPASDRYQLRASDALGRAVWSLEVGAQRLLLLDARGRRYCRQEGSLAVPSLDLGVLPLESLPAVLLGYLPVPPPSGETEAKALDWRDAGGRRWTAQGGDGAPASWTLWRHDRPLAWWTRQADGGILSHRNGTQMRWRKVLSEPLAGPPATLTPPAAYRETSCAELHLPELREGQSPPAGGGPAR